MIKKRRIKKKILMLFILFIIFLFGIIYSLINIITWKVDSIKIEKETEEINELVNIVEIEDTEETETIEQEEIKEFDPYWDYIKMNLINVDFKELKSVNKEVKGWIQVNGTNINYPFVQAKNNSYYLNHSFDKSYNRAGWVFLDYRNKLDSTDKNTIIYGHGRLDTTMFGSLKNALKSNWLHNSNNYVVKLSTEYENTLWQVFSIYKIPTTSDYIETSFSSDEEFIEFSNMLINRSAHNFNTTVTAKDRILTLSTCYNDTDKVVLHAKLIKREVR